MKRDYQTERYTELIDQLADEVGRTHGWKKKVANRLGIHPTHISKFSETGQISNKVLARAKERLDISADFFYGSGHYSKFLRDPLLPFVGELDGADVEIRVAGGRVMLDISRAVSWVYLYLTAEEVTKMAEVLTEAARLLQRKQ